MNDQIKKAIDKAIEMGWITLNPHMRKELLVATVREYLAKASFRDVMEFFNHP